MKQQKQYSVYLIVNATHSVIYCGVSSKLYDRVEEHKTKKYPRSFTARYNVHKLVYYEVYDDPWSMILREKQIKAGNRKAKEKLINEINPEWRDLHEEL